MSHAHTLIRSAIKTALTGLATTGARVHAQRRLPLAESQLPALRIYLDSESAEDLSADAPAVQQRRPVISVECCAKLGAATLDDQLDQMALEVEAALALGITVDGVPLTPTYSGCDHDDDMLDKPVAIKRLQFTLKYHALATAPDALI